MINFLLRLAGAFIFYGIGLLLEINNPLLLFISGFGAFLGHIFPILLENHKKAYFFSKIVKQLYFIGVDYNKLSKENQFRVQKSALTFYKSKFSDYDIACAVMVEALTDIPEKIGLSKSV
jgi:hypothetical protein